MKIATWNVNSIRIRQQQVAQWLETQSPDVLCLQETKVVDQDFPEAFFKQLGYYTYISGQKTYNGVAILSRIPLEEVSRGFTPILGETIVGEMDEQKRLISGVVENIRLVNVYVPNGASLDSDKYSYKLRWLSLLRDYLQSFPEEICLCGDFNIAREDRDIYNPKGKESHIMASDPERQALEAILELGFQDAFRKFTQAGGHYSWWDYRQGGFQRDRGWRIDHLYLTQGIYEQAQACYIDKEPRAATQPSDHAPVIVEL